MTDTTNAPASPDDEPTPEEIAAAGTIRDLEDLPSAWTVIGEPAILSEPTLQALSEPQRAEVMQRAGSNDPAAVRTALFDFLRERQREARIRYGPGENATETEREALDQMNQLRLLSEEHAKLKAELAEVREHRTEYDADGNAVPVPVYASQGSSRTAKANRLDEIGHQMALIAGPEGETALKQAARADALRIRKLQAEVAEAREINRRAHEFAREDRINERARAQAKHL